MLKINDKAFIILIVSILVTVVVMESGIILSNLALAEGNTSAPIVFCVLDETGENPGETLAMGENILKVKNSGGHTTEKWESVRIVVIPKFWEKWWFKIMVLLGVTGIFFALYGIRMKYTAKEGTETVINRNQNKDENIFFSLFSKLFSKYKISPREQEVVFLISRGESYKAVGDKLYISQHTVKNHMYRIYRKMGIKNRVQLSNMLHYGR